MIRCEDCNRHIFETEAACPFCTTPRRRLRNGLLAAGLAVLTGCPVGAAYGAPPQRADADVATDAMVADAAPKDQGAADATPDATADAEADMPIAVPPYGVPPGDE